VIVVKTTSSFTCCSAAARRRSYSAGHPAKQANKRGKFYFLMPVLASPSFARSPLGGKTKIKLIEKFLIGIDMNR